MAITRNQTHLLVRHGVLLHSLPAVPLRSEGPVSEGSQVVVEGTMCRPTKQPFC